MRTATAGFKTRLLTEVSSPFRLWRIVSKAGDPFYFTDSDIPVVTTIDGEAIIFQPNEGFEASAVAVESGGGMQGLAISLALSYDEEFGVTELKIDSGVFDGAESTMYAYDRAGLTGDGAVILYKGIVGEIEYTNERLADFNIISVTRGRRDQIIVDSYSKICRARFCDDHCGLDIADYKYAFIAENTEGDRDKIIATSFDQPAPAFQDDFWSNGFIEFTTGKNAGIVTEIATHSGGTIYTFLRLPYPIETNDAGFAYRGCDKRFQTCKGYQNTVNFRGEPFDLFVPKISQIEETLTKVVQKTVPVTETYLEESWGYLGFRNGTN